MTKAERPRRPKLFVTRRLPESVETRMAQLFDAELRSTDEPLSAAALQAAVADIDILVPTVTDEIDAALIAKAGPRLKMIANFGNGVDHIDLPAARAGGIIVTNTPGVLTDDTADMTMTLILAVARRLAEGVRLINGGGWSGWSPCGMLGHRITGKRLGIIGMGRIGQAVARRARAFGLSIHYNNRVRLPEAVEAETGAQWWPDLDAMLGAVDMLTIHCPHTDQTHHLLDRRRLALLPANATIVNTARGDIIDEGALIDALERGALAGAALDVFEHEPAVNPRLIALPNVLLLPHMGSATFEARHAMGEKVIANIRSWTDGHRPPDQVLEGWA